jgi:hypothetical protein
MLGRESRREHARLLQEGSIGGEGSENERVVYFVAGMLVELCRGVTMAGSTEINIFSASDVVLNLTRKNNVQVCAGQV